MSAIETDGLSKSFGELAAVDGLDLAVEAGECYGLLGPNGAGKTTAIELLTGQLEPDAGTASVLGCDPAADPLGVRERVGVLPEKEAPPSFLTPREFFQFVGRVRGIDRDARAHRVERWSDRLGLGDHLDTLSADLSRGNQQKVMIAAAFLHEPDAVFIDEPLANLDPIVQERVKDALASYAADNAVVLSTHHVEVAAEICTTVGIVHDGRLVAERRPAELDDDRSLLDEFLDAVGGTHAAAVEGGGGADIENGRAGDAAGGRGGVEDGGDSDAEGGGGADVEDERGSDAAVDGGQTSHGADSESTTASQSGDGAQ